MQVQPPNRVLGQASVSGRQECLHACVCAQVRHLNTLGVRGCAAALRCHGLGLADHAVNCAYAFLARRFGQLSQARRKHLITLSPQTPAHRACRAEHLPRLLLVGHDQR